MGQGRGRRRTAACLGELSSMLRTKVFQSPKGRRLDFTELGFGGAPLGNYPRAMSEVDAEATVEAAWSAGIRFFDTAPLYGSGLSESRMGAVLRGRPRESYLLSSKVGR